LKRSPVPYTPLPVNEVVALGGENWRFNDIPIDQSTLLIYAKEAARLNPHPVLLVDFAALASAGRKRQMMEVLADAAQCTSHGFCVEGTISEYRAAR
jgi:hypothetical protein